MSPEPDSDTPRVSATPLEFAGDSVPAAITEQQALSEARGCKVQFLIGVFLCSLFGTALALLGAPQAFLRSGEALSRELLGSLTSWLGLIGLLGIVGLLLLIPRASRSFGTFVLAVMISGWAGVLAFVLLFALLFSLA